MSWYLMKKEIMVDLEHPSWNVIPKKKKLNFNFGWTDYRCRGVGVE